MTSFVYKGYKISAEVQLYDWYDIDENGRPTESQRDLIDADSIKIDQWNVYHKETGDEYWLDAYEYDFKSVKAYIDNKTKDKL